MQSFSFIVEKEDVNIEDDKKGLRIDTYLNLNFDDYSRTFIQKIIKDGLVTVNEKVIKANYIVKEGDSITIDIEDPKNIEAMPEDIDIKILYEDDDIVVVNKPKGMVVHPAPGNYTGTLVNAMLYHCKGRLSDINGTIRPGIVHRIDKDTSGILVIAKTSNAHRKLTDLFKEHDINRKYHAIVVGNVKEDMGTIDAPIGRDTKDRKRMAITEHNSKRAVTHYKVLERFKGFTYIECTLETGRTHQIRVHMASLRNPLLGDSVYGEAKNIFKIEGQMLFAKVLGFKHPITNEYIEFEEELPEYFSEILEKLRNKYEK